MKSRSLWQKLFLTIFLILLLINESKSVSPQPKYTEDLQEFKKDKYSIRLEFVVGCWVISERHVTQQIPGIPLSYKEKIQLIKLCMKNINRKDAVVAITSLAGRNMTQVRTIRSLVDEKDNQTISFLEGLGKDKGKVSAAFERLEVETIPEFDRFLLGYIEKYDEEIKQIRSKGSVDSLIDEQVKKRTKYYFGFIPANLFTHTTMMITLSLSIVCCCTCYKYSRKLDDEKQKKMKGNLLRGVQQIKARPGKMHKH